VENRKMNRAATVLFLATVPAWPQARATADRVAYADRHFAYGSTSGSSTDRGQVYIAYGPPDEIESHPDGEKVKHSAEQGGGTTEAYPFEQWRYRHNAVLGDDFLFEFIDSAGDREYRLTFMGGPRDLEALRGTGAGHPAKFGPVSGLYVEVNYNGTLSISAPVRGSSALVDGKIVDRNGATVQTFNDVAHSATYSKWMINPLPPGQYMLRLEIDRDMRVIAFEAK
jgi:GWxTD domain-containing protein